MEMRLGFLEEEDDVNCGELLERSSRSCREQIGAEKLGFVWKEEDELLDEILNLHLG